MVSGVRKMIQMCVCVYIYIYIPDGASGKELGLDTGWIPGSGRSLGGVHSNPLQYSCLPRESHEQEPGGLQSTGSQRDTSEAT